MSEIQAAPEHRQRKSLMRRVLTGLLAMTAVVLLLLLVAGLLADTFLNTPQIKDRIRQQAATAGGVELDYQAIGISYYPLPAIELRGLGFTVPGKVDGSVATVRLLPHLAGLFSGSFPAGRLELIEPELSLTLQELQTAGAARSNDAGSKDTGGLTALAGLTIAGAELVVRDGRFTVSSGDNSVRGEGLALKLQLSAEGLREAKGDLEASLARLVLTTSTGSQDLEGLGLMLSGSLRDETLAVELRKLALVRPGLEVSGNLQRTAAAVQLEVRGQNIEVAAVRETALAVAGTISPIPELFTYLTGGTIPSLRFVASGADFTELGEYANFRLEGQLGQGLIAIPEIDLALTEVAGDVRLVDGVLHGSDLSARLGKTTGHAGTLALGLAEDDDLFSLQLLVQADLAEAKSLLAGLVDTPQFAGELARISMLEGTGSGKLLLGDSFANLKAEVKDAELQLAFSHDALPYPLTITGGAVSYLTDSVTLQGLTGTFGASTFAGLSGTLDWQQELQLDMILDDSQLVADELFPWLKQHDALQSAMEAVRSLTGSIHLDKAHFSGRVDMPENWQYGVAGELKGLTLKTAYFPGEVKAARGGFALDGRNLTLQQLRVAALDGDLLLQGSILDWQAIDLTIEGTLGKESVSWLEEAFKVPAMYAVRSPLSLSTGQLSWKKNGESRFAGSIAFATGPALDVTVKSGKEGVRVERLQVKGLAGEQALLTFTGSAGGIEAGISGRLGHETLEAVFVQALAGKGRIDGEIGVKIPSAKDDLPMAHGRLVGSQLQLPLAADDTLQIGQLKLQAEGSGVQVEIGELLWRSYRFHPVKGRLDMRRDGIRAEVEQLLLCTIPASGEGIWHAGRLSGSVNLDVKNIDVTESYTCLTEGVVKMTGTLDITGRITAAGAPEELVQSLAGPLEMRFAKGVIRQGFVIAKVLEVLNVTEVFRGRLPNLATNGFPYSTITMRGKFGNGKFLIEELTMDGETLELLGTGYIDLEEGTLEVEMLAAPFKTVDSIIKRIPGVNYLLGGSLVAIPLKISGKLANPRVAVMSPSSVSKSLLNLGERTIKMPFKLIQSVLPGS